MRDISLKAADQCRCVQMGDAWFTCMHSRPCAQATHLVPRVQLHPRLLHQLPQGGAVKTRSGSMQRSIAPLQIIMWAEQHIFRVRMSGRLTADVSQGTYQHHHEHV